MIKLGFNVVIEEGETGQFELFRWAVGWDSYMKEGSGIPKFFTLRDVELKLSGHSTTEK